MTDRARDRLWIYALGGVALLVAGVAVGLSLSRQGPAAAGPIPDWRRLDGETFVGVAGPAATPEILRTAARGLCGDLPECTVILWPDARFVPAAAPIPADAYPSVDFIYQLSEAVGDDTAMWDCGRWPGPPDRCMGAPGFLD